MENNTRTKPGQTGNADYFPLPHALVCVKVPKVFDQVSVRDCVNRSTTLFPGPGVVNPLYTFESAEDFTIAQVKVISKNDIPLKPEYKRLKLKVKLRYKIYYSDGVNRLAQMDETVFNLNIREIYCPDYSWQTGMIHYPEPRNHTVDSDGLMVQVDGLAQAFNDEIDSSKGLLHLVIGVFFIVKSTCVVNMLMPSYGYCPVPPEQDTCSNMTCALFIDQRKTPFPTRLYLQE